MIMGSSLYAEEPDKRQGRLSVDWKDEVKVYTWSSKSPNKWCIVLVGWRQTRCIRRSMVGVNNVVVVSVPPPLHALHGDVTSSNSSEHNSVVCE